MTRNSWLALGSELISSRGTEYLKIVSNNDPVLLYMLSGLVILKNTNGKPLPKFDTLWSYHKGNDPTYVDPKTKEAPPGFENQCAINMSYALQKSGVNMSSFKGKTVYITENNVKIYLAADIYQLAKWVINYFQSDLVENGLSSLWATNSVWKEENVLKDHSRDTLNYDQKLLKMVKGQRGILILYDFWRNQYNQLRGHIDLWDGNQLRRGINEEIIRAKSLVFIPLP